jgi:N-dimethylarginine dimethylaminohydrolase
MSTQPAIEPTLALNPTTLDKPAYLMCLPFSHSAATPNNIWMEELSESERIIDRRLALNQCLALYHCLAADAVVYLLPTPARCRLQDLVFTANLGVVLEHLPDKDIALVSNFTSEPRRDESPIGRDFLRAMGYRAEIVPYRFEGEAELKHLHDNVYLGGCGLRSERRAYEWMEERFDMHIIKVKEVDPYLYHLDCSVFPLTHEDTLVCTELFSPQGIAAIEQHTNVIDVSADACYSGICNSVRLYGTILNASNLHDLRAGSREYADEIAKNRMLEDIASGLGLEVVYVNLSEYLKSGALLSCMIMHLNRRSYAYRLV